jgi:hypothetical protein
VETKESLLAGKKLFDLTGKIEVGELIDFSPYVIGSGGQAMGSREKRCYLIAASVLHEFPSRILIEGHQNSVDLLPV